MTQFPLISRRLRRSRTGIIVLADCLTQKMRFLKALSDLQFAEGPDGTVFFVDVPPATELSIMESEYRRALNGLIAHAIKVATGKINPPRCSRPTRNRDQSYLRSGR